MKNVKKLFAVLLATTMLFVAFAMPAFATMDYWTNTAPEGSDFYYAPGELTAEGWVLSSFLNVFHLFIHFILTTIYVIGIIIF